MASNVPEFIKECVAESGVRLGLALDKLEWPSGGVNAAPSELNALIGFQCAVMRRDPEFHFYSEGTMANRGRIDLMGWNGKVSLAIEAKRLNNPGASAHLAASDLDYLQKFAPAYCPAKSGLAPNDWWQKSEERWGLLLITTFLGDVVHEAWEAHDSVTARDLLLEGNRWDSIDPFLDLRARANLERFSAPIPLQGRLQAETATGWILCAAVALHDTAADEASP